MTEAMADQTNVRQNTFHFMLPYTTDLPNANALCTCVAIWANTMLPWPVAIYSFTGSFALPYPAVIDWKYWYRPTAHGNPSTSWRTPTQMNPGSLPPTIPSPLSVHRRCSRLSTECEYCVMRHYFLIPASAEECRCDVSCHAYCSYCWSFDF